jgi:hypothetical protein
MAAVKLVFKVLFYSFVMPLMIMYGLAFVIVLVIFKQNDSLTAFLDHITLNGFCKQPLQPREAKAS